MNDNARTIYTLAGFGLLILSELLRWLAQAPPEMCTTLTSIAGMLMAGGPSLIRPPDQRGNARVGFALVVAGLGFVMLAWTFAMGGCGSRQVVAEKSVGLIVKRGPPCDMSLQADGEEVCRVRSTERCELTIDGEVKP